MVPLSELLLVSVGSYIPYLIRSLSNRINNPKTSPSIMLSALPNFDLILWPENCVSHAGNDFIIIRVPGPPPRPHHPLYAKLHSPVCEAKYVLFSLSSRQIFGCTLSGKLCGSCWGKSFPIAVKFSEAKSPGWAGLAGQLTNSIRVRPLVVSSAGLPPVAAA